MENLQAVIYATFLSAVFCFYQMGLSVMVLEHHLQRWKGFAHLGSAGKCVLRQEISQLTNHELLDCIFDKHYAAT